MNWKNILERAFWTFVEAFLIGIPTNIAFAQITDWNTARMILTPVIMGALGAGLSAVKTMIVDVAQRKKEQNGGDDNAQ